MKHVSYISLVLIICLIGLASCSDVHVEIKKEFESGWSYDNPLVVSFNQKDTTNLFDMELEINHSDNFAYQNIYLKSLNIFPQKDTIEDVFSVDLANSFGVWQGDCSGEKCSQIIPIKQRIKFQQTGDYKIYFYQHSRDSILNDIHEISFRIRETAL